MTTSPAASLATPLAGASMRLYDTAYAAFVAASETGCGTLRHVDAIHDVIDWNARRNPKPTTKE